jgi:Zn-dependent protease
VHTVLQKKYMLRSYRIGTLFGFPIRVNMSFLLMLGVVLLWTGGVIGVAITLLTFASVLVHELGHALVARHLKVPVSGIELHFFGGAAKMTEQPRSAGDEIAIAAAGPAVSLGLAGLGWGLATLTGFPIFALIGWVNLLLGGFNLVPAFPSDGGRIFRALLARRRGFRAATETAVKVSRVVCLAVGAIGLFTWSFQLVAVAAVLWTMGSAERLAARLRGGYGDDRGGPPRLDAEYIPPGAADPRRVVFVWRG